uniref:Uncharacterized protein n=1 Tax=Leersia perrieri TaxID=77586 RepID=A0A0D9XAJ0_9ORYZ
MPKGVSVTRPGKTGQGTVRFGHLHHLHPSTRSHCSALAPFDLQGIRKKFDMLMHRFDEIFARIIQQRTNGSDGETAADFLEYMLKLEKKGGDSKASFTMTNVKALLMVTTTVFVSK